MPPRKRLPPAGGGTSVQAAVVDHDEDAPEHEWKIRAFAIPVALLLAVLFHSWSTGHFLQRTVLSMPVHELGHATTAWWSGYAAVPTVWRTSIPDERSLAVTVILAGVLGFIAFRAYQAERRAIAGAAAVAIVVALVATFGASADTAQERFIFGGDAGAMVIGTLLMLTMFAGPTTRLRTNQLRWGFLVIGAAAYVDTFSTWWRARSDTDVIPFGEIEGVGQSDPSKLVDVFGWSTRELVDRYVTVGVTCGVVLVAAWAYSTWRMRRIAGL